MPAKSTAMRHEVASKARANGNLSIKAIMASSTAQRLDAIVRRHGGTPKPAAGTATFRLPDVGKRSCEGQLALFEDGAK